jgi:hypothetical protein
MTPSVKLHGLSTTRNMASQAKRVQSLQPMHLQQSLLLKQ